MIRRLIRSTGLPISLLLLGMTAACNRDSKPAAESVAKPPKIATATIESRIISRQLRLPGELVAWQEAPLTPRQPGYVSRINVDQGAVVRAGQLLATIDAPELTARRAAEDSKTAVAGQQWRESEARARSRRAQRLEAEARLAAVASTLQRLRIAARTPGVVSGNELEVATRQVEAEEARVRALRESETADLLHAESLAEAEKAARAVALSAKATEDYLRIVAPFSGTITARFAHPGSLASPNQPILHLQQTSRLRLVVNLPEAEVATIRPGMSIAFTVPAYPGRNFSARLTRPAGALTARTRTMPVELDVDNRDLRLSPGMFPLVTWPAERSTASLIVPLTAVAVTTERTFVIRIREGQVEWVDVRKGITVSLDGKDFVEVFGELAPGETIALRGTDELRPGTAAPR